MEATELLFWVNMVRPCFSSVWFHVELHTVTNLCVLLLCRCSANCCMLGKNATARGGSMDLRHKETKWWNINLWQKADDWSRSAPGKHQSWQNLGPWWQLRRWTLSLRGDLNSPGPASSFGSSIDPRAGNASFSALLRFWFGSSTIFLLTYCFQSQHWFKWRPLWTCLPPPHPWLPTGTTDWLKWKVLERTPPTNTSAPLPAFVFWWMAVYSIILDWILRVEAYMSVIVISCSETVSLTSFLNLFCAKFEMHWVICKQGICVRGRPVILFMSFWRRWQAACIIGWKQRC